MTSLDAETAGSIVEQLPPTIQERLDAMSPTEYLGDIHAPLILLAHDRDDQVIPISQSRQLRAALSGRSGVCYTEFTMFKHLDPTKVRLPLVALTREMGKFYLSVNPVFQQSVAL